MVFILKVSRPRIGWQFKARDRLVGVMQNTVIPMFLINRKNAANAGIYMTI